MSDSSYARQHVRFSTFIVSESLFPIRSHGEYYLKVPLRILIGSTSKFSPPHYPKCHPCKSQPTESKSQPANTKVRLQLAGPKGYVNKPGKGQSDCPRFLCVGVYCLLIHEVSLIAFKTCFTLECRLVVASC